MISLDTLRADHLGCYGYPKDTSPNIDQLSKDSLLFQQNYSHSPVTLPSHMSMLTSLYPTSHKIYDNTSEAELELDSSIPTLAEFFRQNNYFTAAFTGGAWVGAKFGFANGFDFFHENSRKVNDFPENLFQQAKNWITKYQYQKFFIFLHTYEIHGPFAPKAPFNKMFTAEDAKWDKIDPYKLLIQREGISPELNEKEKQNLIALYDGEIRYVDEYFIKPLIEMLKSQNLYDNTMIVLTSDHGEEFYEHQGWLHYDTLYEEIIHVPLIIKFPNSLYKNQKINKISRIIDITPSILDIIGINYPAKIFEGTSILNLLKKREKESRVSIGFKFFPIINQQNQYEFLLDKMSENFENLKLILNEKESNETNKFADMELFDLILDPKEELNLAPKEQLKVQRLINKIKYYYIEAKKSRLQTYKKETIDKELQDRLKALGYIR